MHTEALSNLKVTTKFAGRPYTTVRIRIRISRSIVTCMHAVRCVVGHQSEHAHGSPAAASTIHGDTDAVREANYSLLPLSFIKTTL